MPLEKGSSSETVGHNIEEMMHSGHPQKQAVAASLKSAGKSNQDEPAERQEMAERIKEQSSKDVDTPKPASGPMSTKGPIGPKVEGLPRTTEPFAAAKDAGPGMSFDAMRRRAGGK